MNLWSRIADWTILCPTTDAIDPEDRQRELITVDSLQFELWGKLWVHGDPQTQPLAVLKFPGSGGRAERAGPHPIDCWPNTQGHVWAANPPGYGTSGGRAHVAHMQRVADASYSFMSERFSKLPLLVCGNSLGCVSALYVAARFPVAGLLLRNPPPIHEILRTRPRYNWWNFGTARWIANVFPAELNAIENARRATAPAFFVQSQHDRLVPVKYQQMIIDNYAGPKKVFAIPDADHHDPLPESSQPAYADSLNWLRRYIFF